MSKLYTAICLLLTGISFAVWDRSANQTWAFVSGFGLACSTLMLIDYWFGLGNPARVTAIKANQEGKP